jgi:hypothetical protein
MFPWPPDSHFCPTPNHPPLLVISTEARSA